ncbi:MAG: protein-methionine-sulfoxide reductase heme-binding subunit MsrQ [Burkholderiales bacterium]
MHRAAKPTVFLLCLLPFLWLLFGAFSDNLGANPAEYLSRATGDWTLRLLCVALAIAPLRRMTHTPQISRFSRMIGLYVYFYVVWHVLSYAWFDMGFDFGEIVRDIPKRPFILVGFLAFAILTPLAATSFNRAIRTLGVDRWKALHRAIYPIAILSILHFFWMRAGKNDFSEVAIYAVIVAVLLGWRVWDFLREKRLQGTLVGVS